MPASKRLLPILAISLLAGAAPAQTGVPPAPTDTFAWGDVGALYLGNANRLDRVMPMNPPVNCKVTTLLPNADHPSFVAGTGGGDYRELVYDSFRDRFLVVATIDGVLDLWQVSATGEVASLGYDPTGAFPQEFAPAGDGRVYFWDSPYLRLLKPNAQAVTVLDPAGNPFVFCGGTAGVMDLVYDPETNALFSFHGHTAGNCLCLLPDLTSVSCIRKLPLDASGERIAGPIESVAITEGPDHQVVDARSLVIGPSDALLAAWQVSGVGKKIVTIDPVTLQLTPYAAFPMTNESLETGAEYLGTADGAVIHDFYNESHLLVDHRLALIQKGELTDSGTTLCLLGTIDTTSPFSGGGAVDLATVRSPYDADSLKIDLAFVSASQPFPQQQSLSAKIGDPGLAGMPYVLLGSLSGFLPGLTLGDVHVPLVLDIYSQLTLLAPGAIASGNPGVLSASGEADLTINVLPGALPASAVGLTLHHALIVHDGSAVRAVTNPAPLSVLP